MGARTGYNTGTFSWTDLGTSDPDAAKAFYGGLFGWEHEDLPVEGGGTYTMLRVNGKSVCALYLQQAEGAAAAWLSYVTVDDAEASASYANQLGGNVISEPFDVMDAGRMAVLADPQGAVLAVWEPRETAGAELVNDPGALCLNQLNTGEPEDARRFYGELFGWRTEPTGSDEQDYWGIYNGDALNGGMMPLPPEAGPPHWLVYFTTAELDGAVKRVGELGGEIIVPPMPIESGRIAVAKDPQGAIFGLFEGEVDP